MKTVTKKATKRSTRIKEAKPKRGSIAAIEAALIEAERVGFKFSRR